MDSAYLSKHVGKALALGLSEVCQRKPADPIDYLSSWLRKHVENLKEQEKEEILQRQLDQEKKEAEEEKLRQEALLEEQERIAKEILDKEMEMKAIEDEKAAAEAAAAAAATAAAATDEENRNNQTLDGHTTEATSDIEVSSNDLPDDASKSDNVPTADGESNEESNENERKEESGGGNAEQTPDDNASNDINATQNDVTSQEVHDDDELRDSLDAN